MKWEYLLQILVFFLHVTFKILFLKWLKMMNETLLKDGTSEFQEDFALQLLIYYL